MPPTTHPLPVHGASVTKFDRCGRAGAPPPAPSHRASRRRRFRRAPAAPPCSSVRTRQRLSCGCAQLWRLARLLQRALQRHEVRRVPRPEVAAGLLLQVRAQRHARPALLAVRKVHHVYAWQILRRDRRLPRGLADVRPVVRFDAHRGEPEAGLRARQVRPRLLHLRGRHVRALSAGACRPRPRRATPAPEPARPTTRAGGHIRPGQRGGYPPGRPVHQRAVAGAPLPACANDAPIPSRCAPSHLHGAFC